MFPMPNTAGVPPILVFAMIGFGVVCMCLVTK